MDLNAPAAIESITNYREPQPQEALYLLMPTTQNVDRVIRDFSDGRQQYGAAHLVFIEGAFPCIMCPWAGFAPELGTFDVDILGLSEPLFERLASSPAEPHLKVVKELFVNFWGRSWDKMASVVCCTSDRSRGVPF